MATAPTSAEDQALLKARAKVAKLRERAAAAALRASRLEAKAAAMRQKAKVLQAKASRMESELPATSSGSGERPT